MSLQSPELDRRPRFAYGLPVGNWLFYRTVWALIGVPHKLLFRLQGRGQRQIPRDGSLLLLGNHTTMLDPFWTGWLPVRPFRFMASAQLFRFQHFGGDGGGRALVCRGAPREQAGQNDQTQQDQDSRPDLNDEVALAKTRSRQKSGEDRQSPGHDQRPGEFSMIAGKQVKQQKTDGETAKESRAQQGGRKRVRVRLHPLHDDQPGDANGDNRASLQQRPPTLTTIAEEQNQESSGNARQEQNTQPYRGDGVERREINDATQGQEAGSGDRIKPALLLKYDDDEKAHARRGKQTGDAISRHQFVLIERAEIVEQADDADRQQQQPPKDGVQGFLIHGLRDEWCGEWSGKIYDAT